MTIPEKVLMRTIENEAQYRDGLATVPAYLLEQLHNLAFPNDMRHHYTEARQRKA